MINFHLPDASNNVSLLFSVAMTMKERPGLVRNDVAFALLGVDIVNEGLACAKVVGDAVGFILVAALLEDRRDGDFSQ